MNKLTPREPTPEMRTIGVVSLRTVSDGDLDATTEEVAAVWRDMHDAAPSVPSVPSVEQEVLKALLDVDRDLSRVMHELAGTASLCWEPKPTGVFATSQAIEAVEHAIEEIRNPIRAAIARAKGHT